MNGYLLLFIASNSGTQVFTPTFVMEEREDCKTVANIKCLHPEKAVNILSDVQR